MNYWLVKSEPETYSWSDFVKKGRDHWDGVRNYAARKHMMDMKTGDIVLFYHSGDEKQIVGLAKVVREHYPDPTATDLKGWVVVDLVPERELKKAITLKMVKEDPELAHLALVKIPRLSVQPVDKEAFILIIERADS